ncbi:MAG: hypothetical protein RJA07_1416 [Bacteroidota bacterium]|jgi:predicted transposase YbfD/YdcC
MLKPIIKDIFNHVLEEKSIIVDGLNYFKNISRTGINQLSKSEISSIKKEFNNFFNIELSFFADIYPSNLYRVTNNKKLYNGQKVKLQKVSDLLGAPKEFSNINRCNLSGESVFYAAFDSNTALWETKPDVGDYITISHWTIKENQKLNAHSIFHPEIEMNNKESQKVIRDYFEAKKQISSELAETFELILNFFSEEFMKPIVDLEKENYLFSALYSSATLQNEPDINNFKIDAITYPSVKRDYGVTNIAIQNSDVLQKLTLLDIIVLTVAETNYDDENKSREDLIKTKFQITTDKFDFVNDKIIYNSEEDLKRFIELHQKFKKQ